MSLYGTLPRSHRSNRNDTIRSNYGMMTDSSSFNRLLLSHHQNHRYHTQTYSPTPSAISSKSCEYDDIALPPSTIGRIKNQPPSPPLPPLPSSSSLKRRTSFSNARSRYSETFTNTFDNEYRFKPLPLPSIVSLNSLKNYSHRLLSPSIGTDHDTRSTIAPTEISDTVTFTGSGDDTTTTSSSIIISNKRLGADNDDLNNSTMLNYYATDSLYRNGSARLARSYSLRRQRRRQQQRQPNFYGIEDDDDEEEEDDNIDDDNDDYDDYEEQHHSKFGRMVNYEFEYYRRSSLDHEKERRRQSMSLNSSLFDPSIIGCSLGSDLINDRLNDRSEIVDGNNKRQQARQTNRFAYRQIGNRLSIRIKKLINQRCNKAKTKMNSTGNDDDDHHCFYVGQGHSQSNDSLNRGVCLPTTSTKKSTGSKQQQYRTQPTIPLRLKQLFQHSSLDQTKARSIFPSISIGSLWRNKIVVVIHKAFSQQSLNRVDNDGGCKVKCKSTSVDDEKTGNQFVRANSIAGFKKRPLSLTYDLDRINDQQKIQSDYNNSKAHMVAAFEQSLSSMTNRLQQLSSSSELKDCELDRLRKTIETLKQQGGSLVSGCRSFSSVRHGSMPGSYTNGSSDYGKSFQHHLSAESVNSVSSCGDVNSSSGKTKKKSKLKGITSQNANWIRSSFSRAFKKKSSNKNGCDGSNNRDVMSDVESGPELGRRYESIGQLASNTNDNSRSVPSSPLLSVRSFKTSTSSSSEPKTKSEIDPNSPESLVTHELQKQLREKDMELTDMRLDSLTNAHKMEALNDMLNQMRLEMVSLKQDNDRLQRLINHKSLASSASSLATNSNAAIGLNGQTEMGNNRQQQQQQQQQQQTLMERANSLESIDICDMIDSSNANTDTPKSVTLGSGSHCLASFGIGTKTNWDQLDTIVKRLFKEHLIRVDCNLSLGITVDSLACYRVGVEQIQRNFQLNSNFDSNVNVPELLPFGYLVEESHINLQFKSALDSLAFDTLTPKSILNHYLEQLSDGRRLILAGASGMGKTYLAHKLAEYLVIEKRMNQEIFNSSLTPGAIATFNVDHKNAKELRAYLSNIVEQCELLNEQQQSKSIEDGEMLSLHSPRSPMGLIALPIVIILDNLHHIDDSLVLDIFNDLYRMNHPQCPYIIGTLNQNVTSNQTISDMFCRFQFRFASFTVHSEPVKGFLSRYLRRKWLETDAKLGKSPCFVSSDQLMIGRIIDWIPKVSVYLNRFLENLFPQQNICIGPRLFTSCPIDLNGSHIWFADLWNESILPFIIEQVRDHLHRSRSNGSTPQQIYLRLKEKYSDPTEWIIETYPWNHSNSNCNTTLNMEYSDHLNRLRIEDILEKDMMDLIGINLTQNQSSSSRCASSASGKFSTKPPTIPTIANGGVNDIKSIDTVTDPFLGSLLKLKEATAAEINSSHEAISSSTATTIINN